MRHPSPVAAGFEHESWLAGGATSAPSSELACDMTPNQLPRRLRSGVAVAPTSFICVAAAGSVRTFDPAGSGGVPAGIHVEAHPDHAVLSHECGQIEKGIQLVKPTSSWNSLDRPPACPSSAVRRSIGQRGPPEGHENGVAQADMQVQRLRSGAGTPGMFDGERVSPETMLLMPR